MSMNCGSSFRLPAIRRAPNTWNHHLSVDGTPYAPPLSRETSSQPVVSLLYCQSASCVPAKMRNAPVDVLTATAPKHGEDKGSDTGFRPGCGPQPSAMG